MTPLEYMALGAAIMVVVSGVAAIMFAGALPHTHPTIGRDPDAELRRKPESGRTPHVHPGRSRAMARRGDYSRGDIIRLDDYRRGSTPAPRTGRGA